MRRKISPSAHGIGIATEDFGQTANDDVRVRHDFDVHEVPERLVNDYQEVMLIG